MRYIQVLCLGASPSSPSKMLRAKAAAEEAILRELPEVTVMRPTVMIGTEDRILNPWAHFAKSTAFSHLWGMDQLTLKDDGSSMGKICEFGGPEIYTIHELADLMYDTIREYHYVKVPFPVAKAVATLHELRLKKVPFPMPTPTIFNLDQIEALSTDTVVLLPSLNIQGSRDCAT